MTEAEWLTSEDPERMLAWLRDAKKTSNRKLRLFACACFRSSGCYCAPEYAYANDGRLIEDAMATSIVWTRPSTHDHALTAAGKAALLREIFGNPFRPVRLVPAEPTCIFAALDVLSAEAKREPASYISRHWLTDNVQDLAEAAYQPRDNGTLDPARLAVLHDALVEAGCDCEELLRHLLGEERDGYCPDCRPVPMSEEEHHPYPCDHADWRLLRSPHYRGCWAVDLLRGEE